MNKLFITLSLMLLGFATTAQPTEVQAKKLQGYFFSGNDDILKEGPNCFVITKKQEFEKLFGKGRADTPNFSKEWMLVLLMPATKKDIQLEFNRISMKAGTFVEVYCDFNKLRGKMLTYETNPIAVCTIPRFEKVKTINFYEERKKGLELVTLVEVKH